MSDLSLLLPIPREIERTGNTHTLPPHQLIVLDCPAPLALMPAARRLQRLLKDTFGLDWEIIAGTAVPMSQAGITISVVPLGTRHPQGYELTVTTGGIYIVGSEPAGAFYGVLTLLQLIERSGAELPLLRVRDWPDFVARGVMLDVSRDRVPKMETLYGLVEMLAAWKINQVQLYTEHTFAYRNHPEAWAEASPFTGEEILSLDAFCRERFIELVPNQNSFGHLHHWLQIERYKNLAETHGLIQTPWETTMQGPFSVCPIDPGSIELVRSMFDELLPHFSSRMFNVGLDETIDVGQGRSKDAVAELGAGRVYLDYLMKIYRDVKARGFTMQFWGDIIVQHPDLVPELPHDLIALEWGYEKDHPFDQNGAIFAASGVPFYVCPGTATWNTLAGRTDNTLGNQANAAENGLKHGAVGYLNTDWGDRGHWQQPYASYLGFAYGAALSWAYAANRDIDIANAISLYAFRDPTGATGRVAYDLGNVYNALGLVPHNSSVLFWILQLRPDELKSNARVGDFPAENLDKALAAIDRAMAPLKDSQMQRPDANLIRREIEHTAHMMRHAARRGRLAYPDHQDLSTLKAELDRDAADLIAEQEALWHERSRPGGLQDSMKLLYQMREDYA